jgi:phage replication O-like protein O
MASPQKENGFTPIANELIEAFARTRINGEAMQVLMVIIRKTYGFNKKADKIALSQFTEVTGLKKPTVCKALHKLLGMGVITQKDNATAKEYCVVKDYSLWKPLPKKITLPKKVTVVTQKGNNRYPKRVLQKTKDTITKDIPPLASKDARLIEAVIETFSLVNPAYQKWFARPPQRSAACRLIESHGLEQVQKVIKLLPVSNTIPYFPTITTPLELEDRWAKLEAAWKRKKNEQDTKKTRIAF